MFLLVIVSIDMCYHCDVILLLLLLLLIMILLLIIILMITILIVLLLLIIMIMIMIIIMITIIIIIMVMMMTGWLAVHHLAAPGRGPLRAWAVPFIPIPLPEKVLQTSSCTILLYKFVLQTGLGRGPLRYDIIFRYVWTYACNVCMYVCMYGWMDVCMYVCMYVLYVCMSQAVDRWEQPPGCPAAGRIFTLI